MDDQNDCTKEVQQYFNLLKISSFAHFSPWLSDSDQTDANQNTDNRAKVDSGRTLKRRWRNIGYTTAVDKYKFEHHDDISQYMEDYNQTFLKVSRNFHIHPLHYSGPYNRKVIQQQSARNAIKSSENCDKVNVTQAKENSRSILDTPKVETKPPVASCGRTDTRDACSTPPIGPAARRCSGYSLHVEPQYRQSITTTFSASQRRSVKDGDSDDGVKMQQKDVEINLTGRPRQRMKNNDKYSTAGQLPLVRYQLPTTLPTHKRPSSAASFTPRAPSVQNSIEQVAWQLARSQFPARGQLTPLAASQPSNYMLTHTFSGDLERSRKRYVDELVKSVGVPYISENTKQRSLGHAGFCDLSYIFTNKPS